MRATQTAEYSAPAIMDQRDLDGQLQFKSEISDATVKHGLEPVSQHGYEAPEITAERHLDAKLFTISELNRE
jgi:hypothetical protein